MKPYFRILEKKRFIKTRVENTWHKLSINHQAFSFLFHLFRKLFRSNFQRVQIDNSLASIKLLTSHYFDFQAPIESLAVLGEDLAVSDGIQPFSICKGITQRVAFKKFNPHYLTTTRPCRRWRVKSQNSFWSLFQTFIAPLTLSLWYNKGCDILWWAELSNKWHWNERLSGKFSIYFSFEQLTIRQWVMKSFIPGSINQFFGILLKLSGKILQGNRQSQIIDYFLASFVVMHSH